MEEIFTMSEKNDENSIEQSLEINFKDSIIKHPEFIKVIKDEKRVKLLQDETHHKLVGYLRKGPMTIESLFEAFKRDENEKSKKSIYRYLKTLKDAGLVEQVGTRTSESESGDISVENLFGRKAKIFYFFFDESNMMKDGEQNKKEKKKMDRIGAILEILLKPKYPGLTKEKIEGILETIGCWQKDELEELSTNDKISEELVNYLEGLDWKEINYIMDTYKMFTIFPRLKELDNELSKELEAPL
ncbi:MAG: hypothetical protein HeimC3_05070 [Candidatus Heimdallarchaeota archaeon LC_3]|nr:MAG: hypothetical protein HeimC3_05070 [Candidatus Heimdallarchaeota archaeon LC_3]